MSTTTFTSFLGYDATIASTPDPDQPDRYVALTVTLAYPSDWPPDTLTPPRLCRRLDDLWFRPDTIWPADCFVDAAVPVECADAVRRDIRAALESRHADRD